MASWLYKQGYRLDPQPFLSDAVQARALISDLGLPRQKLSTLTTGHEGGIFNGPQFRRVYVADPEKGEPFLTSSGMMLADFTRLPLLRNKDAHSPRLSYLRVDAGTTLISCSGSVGRMAYVRRDMEGMWSSQDVMKVVADRDRVLSGYLYAFLSSRYGRALVTSFTYGTTVQRIEPDDIADLEVPRLGREREKQVHALIEEAAELRAQFQEDVEDATCDLFDSAGLPDLRRLRWHDQPRDLGFTITSINPRTLRALNYAPRYQDIVERIRAVPHSSMGEICAGGQLRPGPRFKSIDSDSTYGTRLIGQRQAFWLRPEGRWIAPRHMPPEVFVADETIMVAAQGTLGENEVFCQAILVTGAWIEYAYTQHFLRVYSGDATYPGAYLFAFLRSAAAFRCLRSTSVGSKQQDLHPGLLAELPVPACTEADRNRIAEKVRKAYRRRDDADRKEDAALEIVERTIESDG